MEEEKEETQIMGGEEMYAQASLSFRPIEPVTESYSGNYNINIEPLTSGYILRVGCQSIAVESGTDVTKLIGLYLSEDKTIGDKWMKSDKIVQKFIKENLQVK